MMTPRVPSLPALILALALLCGCAPSITREMLTPSPTAYPTPRPTRTPNPDATSTPAPLSPAASGGTGGGTALLPVMTVLGDLVLETYPLAPAKGYDLQPGSLDQNQQFYNGLPFEIFHFNEALWAPPLPPGLEAVNQALQPFGYRLERTGAEDTPAYLLYRGQQILSNRVTAFGAVEVNASASDFLLPVTLDTYEVWLLRRESFELWFAGEPRFLPVFAGDALVAIGEPGEMVDAGETVLGVPILVNGAEVYTLELPYQGVNKCPIEDFRAWGEHWVVEREGEVVIDGQPLTETLGYRQVFNWQALGGRPFFLFQDQDRYGISYDGQVLPLRYEEIVRWGCVEQQDGAGYNFSARGNDQIAGFFARRDGMWFYIEARPVENPS